jgi:hypothetical protein
MPQAPRFGPTCLTIPCILIETVDSLERTGNFVGHKFDVAINRHNRAIVV